MRDMPAGPRRWRSLGDSNIGLCLINGVKACEAASDVDAVKAGISGALDHADNPDRYTFEGYHSGPQAFETWADALETGTASRFGQGYKPWRQRNAASTVSVI
jgi:hypothetical protein